MKKDKPEEQITVGGEALMEGIMMRGPKGAAVALRLPNGTIETTMKDGTTPKDKHKILGWPLIRGPVNLIYSMVFGYKCLMESAEKTTQGLLDEAAEEESTSKIDKWIEDHMGPSMMAVVGVIGSVLGVALALGLFLWLPQQLTTWIKNAASVDISRFVALIAGGMRMVIFVGYMFLMSKLNDIRRVFQYHGAEHKSIFCYENGLELTVENVRKQGRLHPRCGTSFMFVMIMLGIILSSVINAIWPGLTQYTLLQVAIKILQFPIIMAVGYEFLRFAGKNIKNPIVRALSFPGLCMQRITTKEPDDGMIEVGIAALKASLGMEEAAIEEEPIADDPAGAGECPELP